MSFSEIMPISAGNNTRLEKSKVAIAIYDNRQKASRNKGGKTTRNAVVLKIGRSVLEDLGWGADVMRVKLEVGTGDDLGLLRLSPCIGNEGSGYRFHRSPSKTAGGRKSHSAFGGLLYCTHINHTNLVTLPSTSVEYDVSNGNLLVALPDELVANDEIVMKGIERVVVEGDSKQATRPLRRFA